MRPWCDIDADVKPWLGIDVSVTTHDAVLTVIRDAVEQSVVNYVEHEFEASFDEEVLDSTKSDVITPPNWPILSVTNLYFYTDIDGSGGQLIDPTQYDVRDYGVVLAPHLMSPRGRGRVKLAYTWGYSALPSDVKLMILQTIEAEFRRKGRKSIGSGGRSKKDESESGGSDFRAWDQKTGLPKEVLGKLNTYKQGPEFTTQPMATRNW
jgi:hypothetical protein